MALTLYDLLKLMGERGASDLHITTGTPPRMRIGGKLMVMVPDGHQPVSLKPADTKALCYSVLTDSQKHTFEEHNELDFSFGLKGLSPSLQCPPKTQGTQQSEKKCGHQADHIPTSRDASHFQSSYGLENPLIGI